MHHIQSAQVCDARQTSPVISNQRGEDTRLSARQCKKLKKIMHYQTQHIANAYFKVGSYFAWTDNKQYSNGHNMLNHFKVHIANTELHHVGNWNHNSTLGTSSAIVYPNKLLVLY